MLNASQSEVRPARKRGLRSVRFWALAAVICIAVALALVICRGGYLLIAPQSLPAHAQAAVVLDGSLNAFRARRAEGMRLLERGVVDHVLVSVPQTDYWGDPVPEIARRYLDKRYGTTLAQRADFCAMDDSVNSTAEEAVELERCLEARGWRSVIVVTSDYHTRRAGVIWRETVAQANPRFTLWVDGVEDGEFEPAGWYRKRLYAKTWFEEWTKLLWTSVVGINRWK